MEFRTPGRVVEASASLDTLRRSFESSRKLALTPRLLGRVVQRFGRRLGQSAAAT